MKRPVLSTKVLLMCLSLAGLTGSGAQVLPRQEINVFASNPAKLASLKLGIQVMKSRPATEPTSWAFQAAMHGKMNAAGTGPDNSNPLFNKCQHAHWWFLPWHRGYIYYFERILQKAANDPTLRLPYWNYTLPQNAVLPAPFRVQNSPLFVPGRTLQTAAQSLAPNTVGT